MIKETMETMTMITVGGDEEDADEKNNSADIIVKTSTNHGLVKCTRKVCSKVAIEFNFLPNGHPVQYWFYNKFLY